MTESKQYPLPEMKGIEFSHDGEVYFVFTEAIRINKNGEKEAVSIKDSGIDLNKYIEVLKK